jgi:phenylacetate-coenzyme A ligase PaaK-like adenylate-forming protein
MLREHLLKKIKTVQPPDFDDLAMEVFHYQAKYNHLYQLYLDLLHVEIEEIEFIEEIPFLPIQLFKNYPVVTELDWQAAKIFTSSGTTGQITSSHHVRDVYRYLENTERGFEAFYGKLRDYCVLALLPSYLEREGSSLVDMAAHFINQSRYLQSGFFLNNYDDLVKILEKNHKNNIPTLLLGVTFALWDLAEQYELDLSGNTIVMETGGMKGRRAEITRAELHQILTSRFNVSHIHSEYGMTEMLSQGYSKGNGIFYPASTLRVLTREVNDPFCLLRPKQNGALNLIDLANLDSCCFIATDDLGVVYADGSFEVKGRLDNSDLRGCNLMVW